MLCMHTLQCTSDWVLNSSSEASNTSPSEVSELHYVQALEDHARLSLGSTVSSWPIVFLQLITLGLLDPITTASCLPSSSPCWSPLRGHSDSSLLPHDCRPIPRYCSGTTRLGLYIIVHRRPWWQAGSLPKDKSAGNLILVNAPYSTESTQLPGSREIEILHSLVLLHCGISTNILHKKTCKHHNPSGPADPHASTSWLHSW